MSKFELELITPHNYKELSEKQQDTYLNLKKKKMLNNAGTAYLNKDQDCFVVGDLRVSCSTNHKV